MATARAIVVVLLAAASAAAQTSRPKIGLALGGGGARGCAHVGVLRALERMHVPIDYIAGTSMGAVVGGLYASGMDADQIEAGLTAIDWHDALNDHTRFKDLSYRRKEDETRYLTEFEAGFHGRKLALPLGLRSAQKLRFILQTYLLPVSATRDFSKLPIPFKAVAADIETGDAVVLDHGDLEEAIRASMSIPGIFAPLQLDGKLLVDGGVADNVPVDVVRAMGADIVIAVDVGSPLLKSDRLGSLFTVTSQVLTLITRRNAELQIANADFVIVPPVAQFGTLDFASAEAIIAAGEREADRQRERLERLAVAPERYAGIVAARPRRDDSNRPLDFIRFGGSRRVNHRIIRAHMLTRPGRQLDLDVLHHDITRVYGLDDFESVTFAMQRYGDQYGLAVSLKEKSWGPTYLRLGIRADDDMQGTSSFTVGANVTRTRVNALGAEWRNDFRLGAEQGYSSEFYQPLDFGSRFFIAPAVQLTRTK
ncbi:MAG TPA: patatin-like phospholipase family protein, partial [Thermoanaerobaculia bacterium]|nr:patatin-like phospholipase family protein [Thermoanaerobaculia bacterium]